jgi:flagellar protein FliS
MSIEAQRAYVVADVQTASPQRLRLMLIDAAIGLVVRAQRHAHAAEWAIAGESFVAARRAVIELLAGIKDAEPECTLSDAEQGDAAAVLARKVRSLYAFLFRLLSEAQLYRDPCRIDDALKLLAMERETWRQVCERTGDATSTLPDSDADEAGAFSITA